MNQHESSEDGKTRFQQLKQNPLFAMSLGSKELFHSNFLAWLLQDEDLKPFMAGVRELFFGRGDVKVVVVDREKCNFDLLIQGNVDGQESPVFVLVENKFKSIPTLEQLQEYTKKVSKKIKISEEDKVTVTCVNCKGVLLAPKVLLAAFNKQYQERLASEQLKWETVSYEDVIECLKPFIDDHSAKSDDLKMKQCIVKQYADFVGILLNEFSGLFDKGKGLIDGDATFPRNENASVYYGNFGEYEKLRIDDLIKKLWAQKVSDLIGAIDGAKGIVGFSRNQPMITYCWAIDGSPLTQEEFDEQPLSYGVEIQGDDVKVFLKAPRNQVIVKGGKQAQTPLVIALTACGGVPAKGRTLTNCKSYSMKSQGIFIYLCLSKDTVTQRTSSVKALKNVITKESKMLKREINKSTVKGILERE